MALKNQILTTVQPKVPLKSMWVADPFNSNFTQNYGQLVESTEGSTGADCPFVKIGGFALDGSTIMSMTLRQDSFLPTLTLTFQDQLGLFTGYSNPIFEPIVSIYVKAQHPRLKPLRGDYLITNIRAVPFYGSSEHAITLDCELYVPNLYNNVNRSYPQMSSLECMKRVAIELNLGFATNEESTNDKMTWINPNLSYFSFIRDEVTKRAYKNDNNFFTCFIDRYYILNFVNVERQMEQDTEFDQTYFTNDGPVVGGQVKGYDDVVENDIDPTFGEVILSNHPLMKNNANFIREFWPISNQGEVLKNDSFRRRVIWYDTKEQKVNSFFIEPLSNTRTMVGTVHQTPNLTDFKSMEVKKWMGFDYGNAHTHNKFARVLNHHNSSEMNKNQICVRLHGFNSTITRATRVPVTLYDETYVNSIKKAFEDKIETVTDDRSFNYHPDEILSDIYYVKDIVYRYEITNSDYPLWTEFILAKRNWKKTNISNADDLK